MRTTPRLVPVLRRRPGRPAGAKLDLRERLLDAAVALYAQAGIAAASLRAIAAQAHVTPAMVHYYFGNKEQLRDAVIEERLMPIFGQMRERLEAAGDDPRELVASFVRGIHGAVARFPWLPALWVREVLSADGALRDVFIPRIAPHVALPLAERLAHAQEHGRLHRDLDPRLLVVSLIGLALFPFAAAPVWHRVFAGADVDAATLLRHTLALLDHGVASPRAR
jgi:AcrR family transcriptional regulator